jgi:hypothetical protein
MTIKEDEERYMSAPKGIEINCETGEVTERTFTAEEIAQQEADAIAFAARLAEETAAAEALAELKASAKAKLVAGQPLTEEEAATIVL